MVRIYTVLSIGYLALLHVAPALQVNHGSKDHGGYCDKNDVGSLEDRVAMADVVITGTIIRLVEEKYVPDDTVPASDGEGGNTNAGSYEVAVVKLWRVVKGSLEHVQNQTIEDGEDSVMEELGLRNRQVENEIIQQPMIKVYGIGNDLLCGSFVTPGDTRIFFLQKLPDVRDLSAGSLISRVETAPRLATPTILNPVLANATMEKLSKSSTEPETAEGSGGKKKKKNRKNKGGKRNKKGKTRSGKKKKNKKNKSKEIKKKMSKRSKKEHKKRSEPQVVQAPSESRRSKRSSSGDPFQVNSMKSERSVQFRAERDADRAVLLLNASPARITLDNLNSIEKIAKRVDP